MSDNGKRSGSDQIVPLEDRDAFWLTDLYPDARALFEHEQVSLDAASQDCIVVLDANVLLLPFEFTSASVGEVERVYTELCKASRLVVPGQAAREFYKNRSKKLTAIADAIDGSISRAKKQIFEKPIPLLENDPDYKAAREIANELAKKGNELSKRLDSVNDRLKDEVGRDPVSLLYKKFLGDCVADYTVEPNDRDAVCKEVARRARLRIAPGYKDQAKEDGGIGDYLVWQTILQEGRKRKVHCIFVTEEEKPDWWIRRHGTFQPRPELIEEYRRESDGKSLHLVPLSGLLAVFKATDEVVKQVQDVEEKKKRIIGDVKHSNVLGEFIPKTLQRHVILDQERRKALERFKGRQAELQERLLEIESDQHELLRSLHEDEISSKSKAALEKQLAATKEDRENIIHRIKEIQERMDLINGLWYNISKERAILYKNYISFHDYNDDSENDG